MPWEVPAGLEHEVQSLIADQLLYRLLVQHQVHLVGPVACHRQACIVEVGLCFCGP